MTFTIDSDATPEEWDAFLAAVEADALGEEPPATPRTTASPAPPAADDLVELLTEVWGLQVGVLHRP